MFFRTLKNLPLIALIAVILLQIPSFSAHARQPAAKKQVPTSQTAAPPKAAPSKAVASALQTDSQSAVLMDATTGKILFEQNPDLRIPPASFVKVMTLYVAHDAIRAGQLKPDDLVTVSEKAWRTQGSKMFIGVGERVRVDDLFKGIAIVSGNDACIAMAEHLAGSEMLFTVKMNEKAQAIGMKNSQFKNVSGLPAEGQYTTAIDIAILAQNYIRDHPEALAYHSALEYEFNKIKQGNRNTLLYRNIGVDGLKTGYVEESGYHLVATAKRDDQRMIAVVMGCDKVRKRGPEAQKLLEYGFRNFSTIEPVKKDAGYGPIPVKWGKQKDLKLTAAEGFRITIDKAKEKEITVLSQIPANVKAPIQKGAVIGKLVVQDAANPLKEIDLLAVAEVRRSLFFTWPFLYGGSGGLLMLLFSGLWLARRKRKKFK
jgi:serine-type D-Ala-D-Ala carboxypeptidase (penicillin-binding protein 5/6)